MKTLNIYTFSEKRSAIWENRFDLQQKPNVQEFNFRELKKNLLDGSSSLVVDFYGAQLDSKCENKIIEGLMKIAKAGQKVFVYSRHMRNEPMQRFQLANSEFIIHSDSFDLMRAINDQAMNSLAA